MNHPVNQQFGVRLGVVYPTIDLYWDGLSHWLYRIIHPEKRRIVTNKEYWASVPENTPPTIQAEDMAQATATIEMINRATSVSASQELQ